MCLKLTFSPHSKASSGFQGYHSASGSAAAEHPPSPGVRWLCDWAYSLAGMYGTNFKSVELPCPNAALFVASRLLCKKDGPTAQFLLPYLLYDIVAAAAEQSQKAALVRKEIVGVLKVGTLICCGALWTPRCHIPCHVTVL